MADIEVSYDLQNKKDINASFSDVIDINLQKEIKMGIELNAPLYIGADTNLQKQVTQNTADIADLKQDVSDIETDIGNLNDLDTVDKSSVVNAINEALSVLDPTQTADYINNSKGLKSGEVSTNSIILNDIKEYAHSTFDRSKFTVVGSPIITDDGIASGFTSYNTYIDTGINISSYNTWDIYLKLNLNTVTPSANYQIFLCTKQHGLNIGFLYDRLWFGVSTDGSSDYTPQTSQQQFSINTDYWFHFSYKNGIYKAEYSLDGKNYIDTGISITKGNSYSSEIGLGSFIAGTADQPFLGSIDLKQFSTTVDGVEVFSGNKTGIDTIKPDDYTVVGTPTISADGVASGFSSTNALQKTLDFSSAKTWEIQLPFKTGSDISSNQRIIDRIPNSPSDLLLVQYNGGRCGISLKVSNNELINLNNDKFSVTANTEYLLKIGYDGTSYYVIYNTNGVDTLLKSVASSDLWSSSVNHFIGHSVNSDAAFSGTMNLNAFKIYVDGDLVYQPCLKIPFTESKTGSKIVNSIYRPRVNDMAEQFGYANYYTLDEDNGNFTLPQVELYGLIGQRTLRDSYRNGINYWELYSNRDLEQGGSCTSGVEVTFARPFADTNYVLSVPYSAKSTTAFTPTQTGDWIAKGKGLL